MAPSPSGETSSSEGGLWGEALPCSLVAPDLEHCAAPASR